MICGLKLYFISLYRVRKQYQHRLVEYQKIPPRDTFRDTKGDFFPPCTRYAVFSFSV